MKAMEMHTAPISWDWIAKSQSSDPYTGFPNGSMTATKNKDAHCFILIACIRRFVVSVLHADFVQQRKHPDHTHFLNPSLTLSPGMV